MNNRKILFLLLKFAEAIKNFLLWMIQINLPVYSN